MNLQKPINPNYLKVILGPGGCLTTALAKGEVVALKIVGDCMRPDLGNQSSVRLEWKRFYIPGDVIAFHCTHQQGLMVHRFLGYVWRRGGWKLITMADQGIRPDPLINASQVIGRVIAQDGREYRITPARRLGALCRYATWCARVLARRRRRSLGSGQ